MPRGGPDASCLDRVLQTDRDEYLDRDSHGNPADEARKRSVVRALELTGEWFGNHERFAAIALEEVAEVPDPRILKLGSGHGGLSAKLLEMHPTARLTVTDLELGSFSEEPPWVVDPSAMRWRWAVPGLRDQIANELPRLTRAGRLPPGARVVRTTARLVVALCEGRADRDTEFPKVPPEEAARTVEADLGRFVVALGALDAETPVPNWAAVAQTAAFWQRRAIHELAVHRWDAETIGAARCGGCTRRSPVARAAEGSIGVGRSVRPAMT